MGRTSVAEKNSYFTGHQGQDADNIAFEKYGYEGFGIQYCRCYVIHKNGPLKVTGAPNGNTTYEITFPYLLPSAKPKNGLEVGTFEGSPGIKIYCGLSGVAKTPEGDVEFKTTLGDTAILRPENYLRIVRDLVILAGIAIAVAFLLPATVAVVGSAPAIGDIFCAITGC